MKRYLNWVLGVLAAVTALAALRRREETSSVPATVSSSGAATPVVAVGHETPMQRVLAVLKAVLGRMKQHNMTMIAGSLSYYAFLAIFPAAIAALSIYGVVADPTRLAHQIDNLTSALPASTAKFISDELTSVVSASSTGLTFAAVFSILGALWSSSAGTRALMRGIDIAYDTPEDRSFLVQRGIALGITVGLIAFVTIAGSAATFLPKLLDSLGMNGLIKFVQYGRWPLIFVMVVAGLGILFKIAPCRPAAKSPWISVGAVVVGVLWVLATVGLTLYTRVVGDLGAAYGALSGLFLLMLWFFISGLIVLFGAELNAELEARNLARLNLRNGRQRS